jgi:hypothetical protein
LICKEELGKVEEKGEGEGKKMKGERKREKEKIELMMDRQIEMSTKWKEKKIN